MAAQRSRHLNVLIDRPAAEVYEYCGNPANLPDWAAGLSSGIRLVDGRWLADSPMGTVRVEFVRRNEFGVLDHTVTLPSGEAVLNPMRVLPNGPAGAEVVFALRQRPGMTDAEFAADAEAVGADLATLKRVLESR